MRRFKWFLAIVIVLHCSNRAFSQQLALGKYPYMMNKSAVLELNTDNQGLLLPRLTDTIAINNLNPPDGMIVFFVPNQQLLVRTNGYWSALTPSILLNNYWSTSGNATGGLKKIGSTDNFDLSFITNNTDRLRISAAGNVGIGTTSPTQKLDVNGNLRFTGALMPNGSAGALGNILVSSGPGVVPTWQDASSYLSGNAWMQNGNNFTALKTFGTASNFDLPFITNNIERMRLSKTGFLGIGTTTPAALLHLSGINPLMLNGIQTGSTAATDSILTINSGIVQKLPVGTFALQANTWSITGNSGTNPGNHFIGTTDNIGFRIRTNNIERLTIDSLGNMGIANQKPNEKLDITGNLRFSGALMPNGTAGTAGYVLTSNGAGNAPAWTDLSGITANTWLQSGNNLTAIKTLGTTSNIDLPFVTNNTERMRITAAGRIGIGITNPTNPLVVKDTLEIRRTGSASALLFTNTASSGDFRIGADGGDIFWQGGGGRNLQMGAYWGIILTGDRQVSSFPAFSPNTSGTNVLIPAQRAASVPLAIQSISGQTANLTEWRNASGAVMNVMNNNGNLGLGSTSASEKLDVTGNIKFSGALMPNGSAGTAGYVLTSNGAGAAPTWQDATTYINSNGWLQGGNNITAIKNFGTTSNFALPFITNNTERMRITETGNIGIGINNPSELFQVNGNVLIGSTAQSGKLKISNTADAGSTDIYTDDDVMLRITNSGTGQTGASLQLKNSAQNYLFSFEGRGGFRYYSRNSLAEKFKVEDNGELTSYGTGTNTLYGKLGVGGPLSDAYSFVEIKKTLPQGRDSVLLTLNSNNGDPNAGGSLQFKNNGAGYLGAVASVDDGSYNGRLEFRTNYTSGARTTPLTASDNKMVLKSNGNLGISTNNPTEKLDIAGNLKLSGALMPNNNAGTSGYVLRSNGAGTAPTWVNPATLTTASSGWSLSGNSVSALQKFGTTTNYDVSFITNNTEAMRLTTSNRLGIGTSNPAESLDVNGNIRISGGNRRLVFATPGADPDAVIEHRTYSGSEGNELLLYAGNDNTTTYGPDRIRMVAEEFRLQSFGNASGNLSTAESETGTNTRLLIDADGNTAIGATGFDTYNPEKLLVDAGSTGSYNLIKAKGSIDNYLQFNIQNTSSGSTASSDVVATANNGTESSKYIDMGINSSGFTNTSYPIISGVNTTYLCGTGNDMVIGNATYGRNLRLFTGGFANENERMRIDGNGNVSIGTTTSRAKLTVDGSIAPLYNGGADLGTWSYKWSNVYALNGVINTSDSRMKKNIHNLRYGLNEVLKLQPVSFNWRDSAHKENKIGLIAQDVRKIVPEVVVGNEAKEILGINYTDLIPVLINAIKEQQKQIEALKAEKVKEQNTQKELENLKENMRVLMEKVKQLESK